MAKAPSMADYLALQEEVATLRNQVTQDASYGAGPYGLARAVFTNVLDRDTSVLDVANNSAETSLYSFRLNPNALYNTRGVRLTMYGDWLNNTAGSDDMVFRMKLGATTVINSAALALSNGAGASRNAWAWEIIVTADNSFSAQQVVWQSWSMRTSTPPTTGIGDFSSVAGTASGYNSPTGIIVGTASEDGLQPLLIDVTVDWTTASANLSWRRQYASLELL